MRKVKELTSGWKFCLTKLGTEKKPEDGEAQWEDIDVPHDWAIYGEFSPENDPQPVENSDLDYDSNWQDRRASDYWNGLVCAADESFRRIFMVCLGV